MPEKYVRREDLPILLRHTGETTLPDAPPLPAEAAHGLRVICLHDAGLQSSVFNELLTAVEEAGASAIALDLPGHGRSGSLDSLPTIEAMTEMVSWVARWCKIDRAVVVGHGMGALVALEWARSEPESVEGLVLCGVGAALGVEGEAIEQMRNVTRGKAPRPFDPQRVSKNSGSDMMRRAYMEGIKTDPRATLVDLEACRAWTVANRGTIATELGCPVRIVLGSDESESNRRLAEQFGEALAKSSTHIIDGAAHFSPLEAPAALATLIQGLDRRPSEDS